MRENKYRGKSYNYDCWLYGSYLHIPKILGSKIEHHFITSWLSNVPSDMVSKRVNGDTVGQYIGINDINGKEIYEGDIVEVYTTDDNGNLISTNKLKVVNFKNGCFRYGTKEFSLYNCCQKSFKVIGNIYDNPELLKGEKYGK